MKKKLIPILFSVFLFITFFSSCKKGSVEEANNSNLITSEVIKIETNYEEGDIKYEGPFGELEIETSAPEEIRNKIKAELLNSYSKQVSYTKSYDYAVAVYKDATCGSYAQLDVNMDCQDSGAASWLEGFTGSSTLSSNKNVLLKFCVIPVSQFERTIHNYAVLNVTSDHPEGVHRINRYFDNEDSNNNNSQFYGGSALQDGYFGDCYFGANTILSFYYFEAQAPEYASAYPNLGFSYYVQGTFDSYTGTIHSDDENTTNANYWEKYWWNGSNWTFTSPTDVNIAGVLVGYMDTNLYFSGVNK